VESIDEGGIELAEVQQIIRQHRRENPFVQIDKGIINNDKISWKAKGLMLYLLGQKEGWMFFTSEIIKHSKDGRDSTEAGLAELEKNGYLVRTRTRNEKGMFESCEWNIYEIPLEIGDPSTNGFSTRGKPTRGKPASNNNNSNNNKSNKDDEEIIKRRLEIEEFEKASGIDMKAGDRTEQYNLWRSFDFSHELIMEAVRIAALKAKIINMAYIGRILTGWENDNITTAEQAGLQRLKSDKNK